MTFMAITWVLLLALGFPIAYALGMSVCVERVKRVGYAPPATSAGGARCSNTNFV